ncbi:phosphatase inhibitor-domain-containing protein [Lineolata rhizophorae]|uniref:Type 1 phosphatases regulator n=1 Tax=Lineolata rhizophorae TaxID=578093 RepID=A0A6A6PCI1_9PEZI|nr:phosphatase inhibitor-domain-containing protein [Lineolata rhizophorae]
MPAAAPSSSARQMATTQQRGTATAVVEERPNPPVTVTLPSSGRLRLRAEPAARRHIHWADDVIDNEGMGKKSSKVCCIYHKPHPIDESSDEDSSDSDSSDSDSDADDGSARPVGGRRGRNAHRHHDHDGGECKPRKPSPNAYEKMPKHTLKKK